MKIFNCILGIFAIFGSVYCLFYPGASFLSSSLIVAILLGAWGFCAIFNFFSKENKEKRSKGEAAVGGLGLALGIAAAIYSILCMVKPGISIIPDIVFLVAFSFWLIISGIRSVFGAIAAKKEGSRLWWLSLVLGIVITLAGFYGIFHWFYIARVLGTIIGILLMTYGIRLLLSVFEPKE